MNQIFPILDNVEQTLRVKAAIIISKLHDLFL